MIINYTQKKDEYLCKYIQEITGDEVFDATAKISDGDTSSLFSERPYLLIADYSMLCKAKSLFTMGRTEFLGSKIFYVLFVDDNVSKNQKNTLAFAKSICAVKNMVLFGCDITYSNCFDWLNSDARFKEWQLNKANIIASCVRDFIPFKGEVKCSYPLRCGS